MKEEQGPGVPEAIPRTVHGLGLRLDPGTLDRVWIFPPLIRGRRERGLVAASRFARLGDGLEGGTSAGEPDPVEPRRRLYSAPYLAERTGKGLTLDWQLVEQGAALPDRLPRVMDGVVRRAGGELGEAREIEIGGDPARFQALLDELGTHLLEPPAPAEPTATPEPPEPPESAELPEPAAPAVPSEAPPLAES